MARLMRRLVLLPLDDIHSSLLTLSLSLGHDARCCRALLSSAVDDLCEARRETPSGGALVGGALVVPD